MDFSKVKIAKVANTRTTKKEVSSSIRKGSEDSKKKPKLELTKAFCLSSYKKVFQFCDKCDTEVVHYIEGLVIKCAYCKTSYVCEPYKKRSVEFTPINLPLNDLIFF